MVMGKNLGVVYGHVKIFDYGKTFGGALILFYFILFLLWWGIDDFFFFFFRVHDFWL